MHRDEVLVDEALVRQLIAEQFSEWVELAVRPVTAWGTDNAVYRLGEDLVVRLPRTPRTSRTLEMERHWLPQLAPRLPLAVPVPVADGAPARGYPFTWSVYRWLPGENATADWVDDSGQLATDLARFVSAMQRIELRDGPGPSELNAHRGEPLARRDARTRASIRALEGEFDAGAITMVWEEALAASEWDGPPVWLHGDLDSRNLLADQGRLTAVIDFGTLSVGDPAWDVMVVWKMLPGDAREAFCAALSVDDATWVRGRGLAVAQAVTALAYYTEETNAILVHEARSWIANVLADGGARP